MNLALKMEKDFGNTWGAACEKGITDQLVELAEQYLFQGCDLVYKPSESQEASRADK